MFQHSIILFDGVCNLCSGAVQFVIKRDYKNQFVFASLQSAEGQKILKEYNCSSKEINSFFLIENGKSYTRSTAALRVLRRLKGLWKMCYAFIIIPAFIRDAVYDIIAKNRYKWFGKNEECIIPTPQLQAKFLN